MWKVNSKPGMNSCEGQTVSQGWTPINSFISISDVSFPPWDIFLTKKDNSNFHKNYLNKEITLVRKYMDVTDHMRLSNTTFSISQS